MADQTIIRSQRASACNY